jgi:hypothetical protein
MLPNGATGDLIDWSGDGVGLKSRVLQAGTAPITSGLRKVATTPPHFQDGSAATLPADAVVPAK